MREHLKRMRDPKWIEHLSTPNSCEICGKHIQKSTKNNAYLCSSECYDIHFWTEKLEDYNSEDDLVVVINNRMYSIRRYSKKWINNELVSEQTFNKRMFTGHNGRNFKIQRNDGAIFEINDLWDNGEISEEFREKMPNNARFITEAINY